MQINVTADWTEVCTAETVAFRIEIAGHTAVVELHVIGGKNVWEFTVLQDHLRIVEVGSRSDLPAALQAAEIVILDSVQMPVAV